MVSEVKFIYDDLGLAYRTEASESSNCSAVPSKADNMGSRY